MIKNNELRQILKKYTKCLTIMTVTSTKASSPTQPTSSPIRRLIVILIAHFNLFAISFKLFQFWFISGSIIFSFAFKSFINDNAHGTQGYQSFERWSWSWFLQVSQFLLGWQDSVKGRGLSESWSVTGLRQSRGGDSGLGGGRHRPELSSILRKVITQPMLKYWATKQTVTSQPPFPFRPLQPKRFNWKIERLR